MFTFLLILLFLMIIDANHFNGGTYNWFPLDPYSNSSETTITIVQSYSWVYSQMACANDVPISSSGRAGQNANLDCISDCATDGGYSSHPINILTDCAAVSTPLNFMTSKRAKNITLSSSNTHFYVAHKGSSWISSVLSPASSPGWSLVLLIDTRNRPDGIINTPPVASVFSPQYAIFNKTISIPINAWDVNSEDDIRCRWAIKSISPSYDECADVCYPSSMPTNTYLSNCTLYFRGTTVGAWYAAAIQVEDFFDSTSTTPMSSVPVQFLIYVTPVPACPESPIILPLTGCLDVSVGVLTSFNITVINMCNSITTDIIDIFPTYITDGMTLNTLTQSPNNASIYYEILTWIPQASQIGPQQLCTVAYTEDFTQSNEYCVTFNVITTLDVCPTTTTSTTSSTTTSTTSSTTTSTTSTTTTTTVTVPTTLETTVHTPGSSGWGLIFGISSIAMPLSLCACCCLYRMLWSPAKRRRQHSEEAKIRHQNLLKNEKNELNTRISTDNQKIQNLDLTDYWNISNGGSILISMYNSSNKGSVLSRSDEVLRCHSMSQISYSYDNFRNISASPITVNCD